MTFIAVASSRKVSTSLGNRQYSTTRRCWILRF